jgi:amidase
MDAAIADHRRTPTRTRLRKASMARHNFVPTRYSNVLATLPPVLEIASGDSVVTTTLDAAGFGHDGAQHAPRGNPMTGPFFVTGAEPGDALLVTIERMTPNRKTGWTYSPLAPGVLDPGMLHELPKRERYEWAVDAQAGTVKLLEPSARIKDWSFPLAPMLGCFGVTPERGQAISTATSGPNGGNMDYRLFGPGATIAFPIFADGALFFLGDGHACQGDGEIAGTGVETSFKVEFSLAALRDRDRPAGDRQRATARPAPAIRHDGTAALGRRCPRRRSDRGEPSARAGGALRHRQCLQPRLLRRRPAGKDRTHARDVIPRPHLRRLSHHDLHNTPPKKTTDHV